MKPATYNELFLAVENKQIVSAKSKDQTFRLFIATNKQLCYFKPRSGRRGYVFSYDQFDSLISFQAAPAPKTPEDRERKEYNRIAKYKKLAGLATFTNSFIESCKNLPSSFENWVADGKKILLQLGITTGNQLDGNVVSIERIGKQYPHYAERLREAIKNKTTGTICSRVPFGGYEMTIEAMETEKNHFQVSLAMEFKNCGNGYYYLLINDDNFIGYDVD